MIRSERGASLVDTLVGLSLVSLVLAGTLNSLAVQTRVHGREDLSFMLDQNLRRAMEVISDDLRAAGDGVPATNIDLWVPWVPGFTRNPEVSKDDPELTLARCTAQPVTELQQASNAGDTKISVTLSASGDSSGRWLILIGDTEAAVVEGISGNRIAIDTDPAESGAQGLSRGYPIGTPICRVDVITYRLLTSASGRSYLVKDYNDGFAPKPVADGITDLQISALEAGRRLRVTLTANGQAVDPLSGEDLTRTFSSTVLVRNADRENS